jgi:succinate dehydrogenase/fumarate reductase-like Fe-S protein
VGIKFVWMFVLQFFAHLGRKLAFFSRRRPGGVERFVDNYDEDHILPLTSAEAERVPGFQRCTGCGLCDAVCPLTGTVIDGHAFSIAALATTSWRDSTAHHLSAGSAEAFLERGDPAACEAVCPEGVPLADLARYVLRSRAQT